MSSVRVALAVAFLTSCNAAAQDLPATNDVGSNTSIPTSAPTPPAGELPSEDIQEPAAPFMPGPALEPITGYGSFSDVSYWEVDWMEVTALQARCANDHGVPVQILPPGDGLSFTDVRPEQHATALGTLDACLAGLNLPEYEPPTLEKVTEIYANLVEVRRCLEAEGYAISDPPSLDVFAESYSIGAPWHPYNSLPNVDQSEWERLNRECPQA